VTVFLVRSTTWSENLGLAAATKTRLAFRVAPCAFAVRVVREATKTALAPVVMWPPFPTWSTETTYLEPFRNLTDVAEVFIVRATGTPFRRKRYPSAPCWRGHENVIVLAVWVMGLRLKSRAALAPDTTTSAATTAVIESFTSYLRLNAV
jgi:hypothetical protein